MNHDLDRRWSQLDAQTRRDAEDHLRAHPLWFIGLWLPLRLALFPYACVRHFLICRRTFATLTAAGFAIQWASITMNLWARHR